MRYLIKHKILSKLSVFFFGILLAIIIIWPFFELYLHLTVKSNGGKFLGVFTGKAVPIDNHEEIERFINNETVMYKFSQQVGWVPGENSSSNNININSIGARSLREYSLNRKDNIIKVAAFGDSFVFGEEVGNHEVWSNIIEKMDPHIEVLNFGVGGYGTDQSYLRLLQKKDELRGSVNVVILGFLIENIVRNVNRYRGWLTVERKFGLPKPVYILRDNRLELIPLPSETANHLLDYEWIERNLSQHDSYYKHYVQLQKEMSRSSPIYSINFFRQLIFRDQFHYPKYTELYKDEYALNLTFRIMEKFAKTVKEEFKAQPLILIFPTFRDFISDLIGDHCYLELLHLLKEKNIPYLDLTPYISSSFKEEPFKRLYTKGLSGHLNAAGNKIVADAVLSEIKKYVQ